jgi:hypothetical protein
VTPEVPGESAAGSPGPPSNSVTYRFVHYRLLTFAVFIPLGIAGVAMLVSLVAGGTGPPAPFVLLWITAYGWNVYWWLFRIAYEVGVDDGSILRWRSITSSHDVPLARVTGIRTPFPPFGFGLKRIIVDGDRSPLIVANQGYRDVVAMIAQFRPDLVIPHAWYDRFFERFAQRSVSWRRADDKATFKVR